MEENLAGIFSIVPLEYKSSDLFRGGEVTYDAGMSARAIIDDIYDGRVSSFSANFPGLGRSAFGMDDQDAVAYPAPKFQSTDWYSVAKDPRNTLAMVEKECVDLRQIMMKGFGTKFDESGDIVWENVGMDVDQYIPYAQFKATYVNLMKFTFLRYRPKLWYIQDMTANHVVISPILKRALGVLDLMVKDFLAHDENRALVQEIFATASDPRFTNGGWPYYEGSSVIDFFNFDKMKKRIVDDFEGTYKNFFTGKEDYFDFKARLRERASNIPGALPPFTYLVNVRARTAGKYVPLFNMHSGIATLGGYLKGIPDARIAQNASFLGNQVQLLVYPIMKAFRMRLKGAWHDADTTSAYNKDIVLNDYVAAESDISRYDLNFAIEVTDAIDDIFCQHSSLPLSAKEAMHDLRRLPIAIPNPNNVSFGKRSREGLLLNGEIMLPSGVKTTADYGSIGNILVTLMYQLSRGERQSDIMDYWCTWRKRSKDLPTRFLILGDDKSVLAKTPATAYDIALKESEFYSHIGVTSKPSFGDVFLQRHMSLGLNKPVMGRMVQQRISNEAVPPSFAHSVIGLASSLNNVKACVGPWIYGWADSDPVLSAKVKNNVQRARAAYSKYGDNDDRQLTLISSLYKIAAVFPDELYNIVQSIKNGADWASLDTTRLAAAQTIAKETTELTKSLQDWLLHIQRNQYSHVFATMIENIQDGMYGDSLKLHWEQGIQVEQQFGLYAKEKLGIPINFKVLRDL